MNNDWNFDESVADRFHNEATSHIPSYELVIEKSLNLANLVCSKSDTIIDVGSAIGYTVKKFIENGFINTYGVESSPAMINKSFYPNMIIHSNSLPNKNYNFVMMNWTLHFILDKLNYLRDIHNHLLNDGHFILTDKLSQSEEVKTLYYDFKLHNKVSMEYILEKENKLKNIMFCHTLDYYTKMFEQVGFNYEILHGDLGFVTFLCRKK